MLGALRKLTELALRRTSGRLAAAERALALLLVVRVAAGLARALARGPAQWWKDATGLIFGHLQGAPPRLRAPATKRLGPSSPLETP